MNIRELEQTASELESQLSKLLSKKEVTKCRTFAFDVADIDAELLGIERGTDEYKEMIFIQRCDNYSQTIEYLRHFPETNKIEHPSTDEIRENLRRKYK